MSDFSYIKEDGSLLTEAEAHELYDEWLDGFETDGVRVVGVYMGEVSDVLKQMDPIAYRCGFADWLDAEGVDDYYEGHPWDTSEEDEGLDN